MSDRGWQKRWAEVSGPELAAPVMVSCRNSLECLPNYVLGRMFPLLRIDLHPASYPAANCTEAMLWLHVELPDPKENTRSTKGTWSCMRTLPSTENLHEGSRIVVEWMGGELHTLCLRGGAGL